DPASSHPRSRTKALDRGNAPGNQRQTRTGRPDSRPRLTIASGFFAPTRRRQSQTPLRRKQSLWRLLVRRQIEIKPCTASVNVLGGNSATMRFDDRADDRETHSEAFLFCREKLLEKSFPYCLRNPTPVITHGDMDCSVAVIIGGDLHLAAIERRVTHGIKGVAHEINQHLLHLSGIAFNRRQIFGQGHFHFAGLRSSISANHVPDRFYHIIQIDSAANRAALLNGVSDIVYDVVSALSVRDHVGKDLLQLRRVKLPIGNVLHSRVGVAHNRGQRLIELVRERRRHFSEQAESGKKIDLLTLAPRLFFGELALRNIGYRGQNQNALRRLNWIQPDLDWKVGAVLSTGRHFAYSARWSHLRCSQKLCATRRILFCKSFRNEDLDRFSD